jgi:P2-related tail formation protein
MKTRRDSIAVHEPHGGRRKISQVLMGIKRLSFLVHWYIYGKPTKKVRRGFPAVFPIVITIQLLQG